ncbi:GntR family transcriptional regulator [Streptomyces scabiei]|uniref:GntR family transcriptional regulator n=1 Tax=Streptomyces scabiei TaxID=1930 RepID=UPI001B330F13|nr:MULTISPECIES: GntR family transcriptional regulator [Streptomyces]MDX2689010.1 GntR family transcriptional regulator [Streptomyces scabiei]MDX2756140.1 GntR family transcriptional regulator [Streptomyces scabiei]MDX2807571.1 GntR family transcriptional regulator [Streptomyces scabiei]MDX3127473.1 GntR family transcriptional regulator [Streptomyces scabiei]MDX3202035.1 GntR family transcriptional regulator [Streptomyces scabiei]
MSDMEQPKAVLDPMSARPLYVQLADVIAGKIASGELAPDRPIPSENHLAEEYGVARLTARRTAQELRERGLIVTVRGKGSFVVEQLVGEAPEEGEPNV